MWMDSSASGWFSAAAAREVTIKQCAVAKATEDPRASSRSQLHNNKPSRKAALLLPATKYVKIREDAPIWKRKNNTEMDLDSGIGNRFPDDGNFQRNGVSAKDCWQKQRVAREGGSERARGGKGQKGTPTVVVTKALWKVTGPPQTLSQYKVFMLMIMLMFMFMFMLLRFHLLLFMFTVTPYHVCHLANEYLFIFAKNNVRLSKTQFLNFCFLARKNQ